MNSRENSSLDFFGIIGIIQKVVAKTSLQNIRAPLLVDREARTSAETEALRGSSGFRRWFSHVFNGEPKGGKV